MASAGGPQFFLQAGTFGEAHNAERQRARLAGFGPAGIHPMNQGGRTLYRVMLGPYARAEDAKNLLSKLASAGIADTSVIRE